MGRTNVRVTGLVFKNDQVLLFHGFKYGDEYWTIPGGGVEEGESLEAALRRELKEELGVELISFTKAFDFIQPDASKKLCHFYYCDIGEQEPKLGIGPESLHSSKDNQYLLTWVKVQELPGLTLFPSAAMEIITAYENR